MQPRYYLAAALPRSRSASYSRVPSPEKTNMAKPSVLGLRSRLLLAIALMPLVGCSISVKQPANGSIVSLTATTPKVHVVVSGNASYNNLKVAIDNNDVTSQMASKSASEDDGDIPLQAGVHTLAASADVYCWYCTGRTSHSTATSTFQVGAHTHK